MQNEQVDAIIDFGSGLTQRRGRVMPSFDQEVRLTASKQLFDSQNGEPVIVVCGGRVFKGHNPISWHAKDYLQQLGVPENKILTADTSRNTLEDISRAKTVMQRANLQTAIAVSSEWHLVAEYLSQQEGFEFRGAEGILEQSRGYQSVVTRLRQDPSVEALRNSQRRMVNIIRLPGGKMLYQAAALMTLRGRARVESEDSPGLQEII